ncbi:MAG: universal stress protein [Rubrivivax sp.]|nr:universal stress protein [Rubrivivax sp.]
MTTFKSLMAATDFSVDGNNAVRRAALLAHEHGAGLRILHVLKAAGRQPLRDWFSPTIDIDLKAAQSREALRRVAVEISSAYDLTPRVEVVVGDPFEALLQASQSADLVVLGQRGHSRLEALRVGGTVDRMLRTCQRPVLVVKTPATQPYRRILVPIDFTAYSEAAVEVAARLRRGAGMHVFHAFKSQREAVLRDAGVHRTHHPRDAHDGRGRYRRAHAPQGRQARPGRHVDELCADPGARRAVDPAPRPGHRRRPHRRREARPVDSGRVSARQRQPPRPVRLGVRRTDRSPAPGRTCTLCGNRAGAAGGL